MKRVSRKMRNSSLGYIKNRNGKVKSSGMCAMLKSLNIIVFHSRKQSKEK